MIARVAENPFAATAFLEDYSPAARSEDGSTLMDLSLARVADLVATDGIENTRYSNLVRRFIEEGASPTPSARESGAFIYANTVFETNPDDRPWERENRDLREHRALVHATDSWRSSRSLPTTTPGQQPSQRTCSSRNHLWRRGSYQSSGPPLTPRWTGWVTASISSTKRNHCPRSSRACCAR